MINVDDIKELGFEDISPDNSGKMFIFIKNKEYKILPSLYYSLQYIPKGSTNLILINKNYLGITHLTSIIMFQGCLNNKKELEIVFKSIQAINYD